MSRLATSSGAACTLPGMTSVAGISSGGCGSRLLSNGVNGSGRRNNGVVAAAELSIPQTLLDDGT